MKTVFKILSKRPKFLALILALFLSSVGSGVTQAVVLGELGRLGADGFTLSLVFVLGLVPGFLSSRVAVGWVNRFGLERVLPIVQIAGIPAVIFGGVGLALNLPWLLLGVEAMSSAVWGMTVPFVNSMVTAELDESELAPFSRFENSIFSSQAILAFGIGTLLWPYVGAYPLFGLDLISYFIAAFCFRAFLVNRKRSAEVSKVGSSAVPRPAWKSWTPIQKRQLAIVPVLALAASPAMALLPLLGQKWGALAVMGGITLSPPLVLMFAKTVGQVVGPWFATDGIMDRISQRRMWLPVLLIGFMGFYLLASQVQRLGIAFCLIGIAHLLSNILFTAGYLGVRRGFQGEALVEASVLQYQVQLVVMSLSALAAGSFARQPSEIVPVLFVSAFMAIGAVTVLEWRVKV